MDIEIQTNKYGLEVGDYIFRKVRAYDEDDNQKNIPYFQAIIKNSTKKNYQSVECRLSYFDENDCFLGFDTASLWELKPMSSLALSVPVSVPETTEKVTLVLEARSKETNKEFLTILWLGFIIAAGLWGLSNAFKFLS